MSKLICLLCALIGTCLFFGCASSTTQQLRIKNVGDAPITNLRVLFPEQEVAFGDVAAGATTPYMSFPKGVYRYAAFRYELNGETITQPVIDWVGEVPMEGNKFTYTLVYTPDAPNMQRIETGQVDRDS